MLPLHTSSDQRETQQEGENLMSYEYFDRFNTYIQATALLASYDYDHTEDPADHMDWFEKKLQELEQDGVLEGNTPEAIFQELKKLISERKNNKTTK